MFNPLPFLALSAVALGYSGAIDRTDRSFEASVPAITGFAAASNLSVQDFAASVPQTVQDPLCDVRDAVTADLSQDFAETLEASMAQGGGTSIEVWTSDIMGTWTVLHVEQGLACIVSSGFGWSEGMTAEAVLQDRPLS